MSQQFQLTLFRIFVTIGLFLILARPCAWAEEQSSALLQQHKGRFQLSLESIQMPSPDDRMGLLGFGYLSEVSPSWSLGISGYGSVSGDRGGFFTGGFTGGVKQRLIENLWLDAGLFVGGGGGGSAAQGGGLMLRSHGGLVYDFNSFKLGAAFSWVDFPNGEIESQHLALTLGIPFNSYQARRPSTASRITVANALAENRTKIGVVHQELLSKAKSYNLSDSARTTSGSKPDEKLNLLGIEFRHFLTQQGFLLVETMGAFGGNADGYAEVLFGAGYRLHLTRNQRFSLIGSFAAGGAGGGEIDTGGGAVIRTEVDLEYHLTRATFAALNGGYIDAVDSSTSGWILGLKFGAAFDTISAGPDRTPLASDDPLGWSHWRFRSSHLSYLHPERINHSAPEQNIHLFGVKLDHFVQDNIYLTGQAAGAYRGGAGGYAVGLIGLGWRSPSLGNSNWRLAGELVAGAGGGGGIAVGEGALVQPMFGIEYSFDDRFSLQSMGGQVVAVDGKQSSTVIDLSFSVRFAKLIRLIQ